jgi:hypothetical protein
MPVNSLVIDLTFKQSESVTIAHSLLSGEFKELLLAYSAGV